MAVLKSRESLAVKYRPRRLEQFIGQDQIVSLLQGQFRSPTGINRSFLLSGATGCGKTSLARVLAHYINCDNFNTEECAPCGKCDYCKDVTRNYYGGVDEINFSNERGIDTVRSVIDSTAYASQYNAHVFICDEIQCLTNVAQNAFLKILEEPPEGVVFLLLTTDPHKLLPTIINRCCPLTLERVDTNIIANHLLKICKAEKRDYFTPKNPEASNDEVAKAYAVFKNIAMFSNGYVRQALATLEAVLSMLEGGQKFDPSDVEAIRKIVGTFVDSPEAEIDITQFLIQGLYTGRYGISLNYALKMIQRSQISIKNLIERTLDTHIQILFLLTDPNRKLVGLTDPFYGRTYATVIEAVKQPGSMVLVHTSAAEIVGVFMTLLSELGAYIQDERRLVIASVLKMLDIINNHRSLAYTTNSMFHKIHAPELIKKE